MTTKKVAIISAVYGGFDKPLPVPEQSHPFDYFLFTEDSGIIMRAELSDRIKAKFFKYQQHAINELKGYDIYIWIDGNFQIKSADFVQYMVRQLEGHDLAITVHPHRDCIFDEAKFIIENNGGYLTDRYGHEKELMAQQMEYYRECGMPEHWGLFCCGLFAVNNSPDANRFMDLVWMDNIRFASQDQNPFPFYAWKTGLKLNRLNISIVKNNFWQLNNHAK